MAKTREQIEYEKEAAIQLKTGHVNLKLDPKEKSRREMAAKYAGELWEFLKQHEVEVEMAASAGGSGKIRNAYVIGASRALLTGIAVGKTAAQVESIMDDIKKGQYSCWTLSQSLATFCFEELAGKYANTVLSMKPLRALNPVDSKKLAELLEKVKNFKLMPARNSKLCTANGAPVDLAPARMNIGNQGPRPSSGGSSGGRRDGERSGNQGGGSGGGGKGGGKGAGGSSGGNDEPHGDKGEPRIKPDSKSGHHGVDPHHTKPSTIFPKQPGEPEVDPSEKIDWTKIKPPNK